MASIDGIITVATTSKDKSIYIMYINRLSNAHVSCKFPQQKVLVCFCYSFLSQDIWQLSQAPARHDVLVAPGLFSPPTGGGERPSIGLL